jgi:hypothetical protein
MRSNGLNGVPNGYGETSSAVESGSMFDWYIH